MVEGKRKKREKERREREKVRKESERPEWIGGIIITSH